MRNRLANRPRVTPRNPRSVEPDVHADSVAESVPERQSVALSRLAQAQRVSERRRVRRFQQATHDNVLPPPAVPIGAPVRLFISVRWFSLLLIIALVLVLGLLFTRDVFYVQTVYVGGTNYLENWEIVDRIGLTNTHIFWVDPAQVAAKLEEDPTIADARVEVGWPPIMVQVIITERQPALIWEQGGVRVWSDVRGRVMALRRDEKSLMRVIVTKPSKTVLPGQCPHMGTEQPLQRGDCIDPGIVTGVLQFKALYPNVSEVLYDPAKGLGYQRGDGWMLWFGDGKDIVTKMAVYNRITDQMLAQGKKLVEVNVSDPDAPFIICLPGTKC